MRIEKELFLFTLTVGDMMDFTTRLKFLSIFLKASYQRKNRFREEELSFWIPWVLHALRISRLGMHSFAVSQEGKESNWMPCHQQICFCWENSTQELNTSTVLKYTKDFQSLLVHMELKSISISYQSGIGNYNLFDKVLVFEIGRWMFYGPVKEPSCLWETSLGISAVMANRTTDKAGLLEHRLSTKCRSIMPAEDNYPTTA